MRILMMGFLTIALQSSVFAAQLSPTLPLDQLLDVQESWAHINYELPKDKKSDAFEALTLKADQLIMQYPNAAEPLVWKGIIMSTWAGAKGGLGALSLVKEAKVLFETSMSINPDALAGSAYTSLGCLYYQVPGWPIAFGDDKKARKLLEQALTINPDGIDSNYFYADYWMQEGEYGRAKVYFEKALQAPLRSTRPIADAGRRAEIQEKLNVVQQKSH